MVGCCYVDRCTNVGRRNSNTDIIAPSFVGVCRAVVGYTMAAPGKAFGKCCMRSDRMDQGRVTEILLPPEIRGRQKGAQQNITRMCAYTPQKSNKKVTKGVQDTEKLKDTMGFRGCHKRKHCKRK